MTLAWACIVHKVQELSLNNGAICFDLHKQKYFSQGQMYVALSRIRSLENLFLIGTYTAPTIKENVAAKCDQHSIESDFLCLT